jgi:hypothetical protein
MKLLAGTFYDPAVAVTKATSSLLAMTAIDTTNLRLTFTAPSNGSVLVRMRVSSQGATAAAQILLGMLDHGNSDAVKARQVPISGGRGNAGGGSQVTRSISIVVTGLTPGTSYTYDAAYGVETVVASTLLKYGGPDDTSNATAAGGIAYEIWDTPGLLGAVHYDPGTAASVSAAASSVVAALDTTNMRLTFTAPSSGNVYVRLRGAVSGTTGTGLCVNWAVLDGATIRFRMHGVGGADTNSTTLAATDHYAYEASGLVTGLTPGTAYTWDAAFYVDNAATSAVVEWGGPNNTTADDAWGGFAFDVWNPDSLPRMIGSVA